MVIMVLYYVFVCEKRILIIFVIFSYIFKILNGKLSMRICFGEKFLKDGVYIVEILYGVFSIIV